MSTPLYAYLRKLCAVGDKYDVALFTGMHSPHVVHRPGKTYWKNGRPKSYTRAVNTIYVGQGWIAQNFPASCMAWKLSNPFGDGSIRSTMDLLDCEIEWQSWLAVHNSSARDARMTFDHVMDKRADDRSFEPETERLYAN